MRIRSADPPAMERRNLTIPMSIRADERGDPGNTLFGYAAKFNERTELFEWGDTKYLEQIAPGAFARTLKAENRERPILALHNHNWDVVLGSTEADPPTLRLFEDKVGLGFEVDLNPDDPAAMAVRAMVKRRDIKGCSFGFWIIADQVERSEGQVLVTLRDVELLEITPSCSLPAYTATETDVRSGCRQFGPPPSAAAEFAYRQRLIDIGASRP